MFTFANCLILAFLFGVASSKSTKIQHQNSPKFWHQLMKENGICEKQVKQMADEMDKINPLIEKLSKEENYEPPRLSSKQSAFEKTNSNKFNQNSTPNQLKHQEKQSLFLNLFKLDNFYELIRRQEKVAKLVQDLAKTFINIKSSMIKIEITTILDKTENAMNFLAEQNGIVHEKAKKIDLREIVKKMATIWSEMSRAKNGGENAKEIVNLWQSVKQNDDFKKYFGNKSEGKKRRRKRWVAPIHHSSGNPILDLIVGLVLIVIACLIVWFLVWIMNRHRN
uniref:Uncharacterized protein n=1 Tax=Globodera rostochiensis TaxID=31243 RepID=A0A914H5P6_GLORO